MESEESFISSDKDVYEGKFGACSVCVCMWVGVGVCVCVCARRALFFRKLTHEQRYYIAYNNEIELKGVLF